MRKIYSFMVAAVAIFAAASCNKELPQGNELPVGETVVYTASVDGADTKAVLNEETKKSEWVADDAITVHDGTTGWTFTAKEAGPNVDFSNSEGFGTYRPVIAVYPAGTYTANVTEKTVNANIPTYQPARKGTYNEEAALAVAYSENDQFAFKNAHSLIKFTIKSSSIKAIEFYGNNNEAITGNMLVSLNDDNTVKSVVGQDTVFEEGKENEWTGKGTWVKIYSEDETNGWCFENGATYYAAVAPVNFTKGVAINYILADDTKVEAVKKTDNPVNLTPSKILNIGDLEYEAPVVHEWAVAGTFNGWSTTANPMELVDGYYVVKNVTGLNFTAKETDPNSSDTGFQFVNNGAWKGGEGKVTAATWAYVWNDNGANIYVNGADATTEYDIYLNPTPDAGGGIKFVVVKAGEEMPDDVVVEEEVVVDHWAVIGSMTDNWASEVKMTLEGDWYVAKDVKILISDQFKFRANGNWDEGTPNRGAAGEVDGVLIENNVETAVYQGGKNFCVSENGMYSVYINKSATKVKVVRTGDIPLPAVKNWGIVGSITNWGAVTDIPMTLEGDWYIAHNVEMSAGTEFKFRVDNKWASDGGEELTYAGSVVSGTEYNVSGGASNISIASGAVYDVYLSHDETKMKVVKVADLPEPDIMAKDGYVYLLPNSNWTQASARFAIYLCNGSKTAKWISMTKVEGTAYYEAKLPDGFSTANYKNIIFVRMNPSSQTNNWNNRWNQSGDLDSGQIVNGKNCCAIKAGQWDCGNNVIWSTVTKLN